MKSSALRNIDHCQVIFTTSPLATNSGGRHKVIHKLGFRGFSTVWLACDCEREPGTLVTLKAMVADASSKFPAIFPKYTFPAWFILPAQTSTAASRLSRTIFRVNGSHQLLMSPDPLLGPSISAMPDSPGRVSGSRRLRGDLPRKVAKGTAEAIHNMLRAWRLTTSNIIFRFLEEVDDAIYRRLGSPQIEEVSGSPLRPHAPANLVEPIINSKLTEASFLKETVVVIGFGQSYAPGTTMSYLAIETLGRAGFEADIWALARAIFELRAGFHLFELFLGSDTDILRQTVEVLGRLPDPWWASFEERTQWFEDDSEPKSAEAQEHAGLGLIGTADDDDFDDGSMAERAGVVFLDEEKMFRYRPEE
ncbi:hypothetical protein B0H14DRAFT_3108724 [Mycena olivaceomarginata]|nr:hypothetical protein B0H14DRAFT_3108724 [Mycena olivaceomarginata]